MDYGRLRAAALSHGEDEEAVTVDTRALIDKVLARYSGEWTTLRELIQNAADAQATTVKVKWETLPSTEIPLPTATDRSELLKHIIQHHTLRRLVVSNNGQPFTKTDWGRLKRIAEGNPDETKIGAFGVGFYSVFADCEEPFISSGSEAMAFYWKGNALFTRKLQLSEQQRSNDTAFVLDYRNTTTPLPNLLSVSQFLTTSLTFVALQNIEFWIDDYQILSLHKKTSPSAEVALSRDVERSTKEGLMRIHKVDRASAQIDASYMGAVGWKPRAAAAKTTESYGNSDMPSLRSFFSRLTASASSSKASKAAAEEKAAQEAISEDITALSTSSIFLRVTTAAIQTSVASGFAAELERATKKPPPKVTKLAILTSSYDETNASESSNSGVVSKAADVFASVLPSKKPGGRIFIGFPTTQTTGAGMHISAPSVIPTVEREAIDLNARWVRTWNIEMLRAAGIMTRLAFAHEMSELQQKLDRAVETPGGKIISKEVERYIPEAMHVLKSFTFGDSTPSGSVSQIIEEAFWTCYKKPVVEIYSTRGVRPTTQVRIGSEELSKFVGGIPVVPPQLQGLEFVRKVTDFDLIHPITVEDVRQELQQYPMNKDQLISFIQWASKLALQGELNPQSRDRLLDAAIATVSADDFNQGGIITVGAIRNYLSPNKIPAGLPIPPTTIPLEFTSKCTAVELKALGWETLEIVPWLRFIIEIRSGEEDKSLTRSSKFAIQVLTVLSKNWDNLSQGSKEIVISLLKPHTVMPTKSGMRKPTESFFPSVKLFDDLPVIQGCTSLKEKFLSAIGVRKTVDLETIFKRLLNPSADEGSGQPKWSHVELIRYLASVRADIPSDDLRKLRESRICPAEAGPVGLESSKGSTQLYRVSELFEPKPAFRPLGVKILQWPISAGGYRPSSTEGKFLVTLGLRPYPTVPELVDMMSSSDQTLRQNAMSYFIQSHVSNGYSSFDIRSSQKPFLPIEGNSKQLVSPAACFTNQAASLLGFNILKKELHVHANKFGVITDPPIHECVDRLLKSLPQNQKDAIPVFQYFASRQLDLQGSPIAKLRDAAFVPVVRRRLSSIPSSEKSDGLVVHISPRNCFLGTSSTYGDIFDFVDFGSQANAFLFGCGAKNEPTRLEVAQLAAHEPARLLSVFQSSEKYLNLLRFLAEDYPVLKRDRELWKQMKTSRFLLGFKEISAPKDNKLVDIEEEEEAPVKQYQLASPSQIVILDDYIGYRLFKDGLICAPEEDVLENFYTALGSQNLGNLMLEELKVGAHNEKQDGAVWLRKHVLERSKIFIHEYSKYTRDPIKHDAKWLEKNLTVEVVRSVALRRTLRGTLKSHTEDRSAASAKTANGWVLYVASKSSRPDMYQVGQAVCQLILNRPSQQAYTFFEPFLKLDLLDLRARGYNVDRILRAKAAEARIAEEERRKALEAEEARIREREEQFRQHNQAAAAAAASRERARTPPPHIPGAFDDTSDSPPAPAEPQNRRSLLNKGGLFSQLSKRFGFEDAGDKDEGQSSHADPTPLPAPEPKTQQKGLVPTQNDGDNGKVTNPAVIQKNLLNAVKATRAHGSSSLFSPPTTTDVKEQATYCDNTSAHDITLAAEASNGMRVFVSKTLSVDQSQFLSSNHSHINSFASLLRDVADVYAINPSAMHIFYDEQGGTIAFNSSGSIFCNLRFFVQLHAANLNSNNHQKAEATVWWWVVVAHELAHNIIQLHNADHSYYTESFIQQYFPKMMLKVGQLGSLPGAPPRAPPPPYGQ